MMAHKIRNIKRDDKEFDSFEALYSEAVEVGILPAGNISGKRFSRNSPYAKQILWYNLFLNFLENKYGVIKAGRFDKTFTVKNFKECIEERRQVESIREKEKQKILSQKKKNWGLPVVPENKDGLTFRNHEGLIDNYKRIGLDLFPKATESLSIPTSNLMKYLTIDHEKLKISDTTQLHDFIITNFSQKKFSKPKPKLIAQLIQALTQLKCLSDSLITDPALAYRTFNESLGPIGSSEGLRKALLKSENTSNFRNTDDIKHIKETIQSKFS